MKKTYFEKIYKEMFGASETDFLASKHIDKKNQYIENIQNAKSCIGENKFEEADIYLLQAIECEMTLESLELFVMNCINMGRIVRAQIYLHKFLKDDVSEQQGNLYLELGKVYELMSQFDNAIEYYKSALSHGQNDANYFLGRIYCGLIYNVYKNLESAFFYFESAYNSDLSFSKGDLCAFVEAVCEAEGLKDKKNMWQQRKTKALQEEFVKSL